MPFDESTQDEIVSSSNINSLEKYKFIIDRYGFVNTRQQVNFGRQPTTDGFNRLRVSYPIDLFDNKNTVTRNAHKFIEVTSGGGALTYEWQTSSVLLTVNGNSGDRALRQTRYLPYTPGKSQLVQMSGVLADSDEAIISIVRRTSTSGAIVENNVSRESWNRSQLKGFDFTKSHVFNIDFQWLGTGNVRLGIFGDDGILTDCHEMQGGNVREVPYMRTATLPMRYEIVTTDTEIISRIGYFDDFDGLFFEARKSLSEGTHQLREICCTCASESALKATGTQYHANAREDIVELGVADGGAIILAVRLSNLQGGHPNRAIATYMGSTFFSSSQNCMFEIFKIQSYVDNGTTWTEASINSACEYSTYSNIDITITEEHIIGCRTVTATSTGSNSNSSSEQIVPLSELLDDNRIIKQNYDSTHSEIFVVKAYPMGNTEIGASITWVEYD